jgi:transposase
MSKQIVSDELWGLIEPILPKKKRRFRYPGRKRVDDRKVLTGIIFVLKTGIQWEDLPQELGCGCGMTCWRRLEEWHRLGVWKKLHTVLLQELSDAHQINWSRAIIDSSSVRSTHRGSKTGPNPTDRAKHGSKHHLLTDAEGVVLATSVSGANRNDITELQAVVEAIPPIRKGRSRARRRPKRVQGDRGYDSEPHRQWLKRRKIIPELARRRTPHGSGLGVFRWVVERTIAWLHQFRRLRVRDEVRSDIHEALLTLAGVLVNMNFYT